MNQSVSRGSCMQRGCDADPVEKRQGQRQELLPVRQVLLGGVRLEGELAGLGGLCRQGGSDAERGGCDAEQRAEMGLTL